MNAIKGEKLPVKIFIPIPQFFSIFIHSLHISTNFYQSIYYKS